MKRMSASRTTTQPTTTMPATGPRERGDERHQHVDRRREAAARAAVEPHERRLEPDREQRADLDVEEQRRVARQAELRPQPLAEEERPGNGREDGDRPERSRGASGDHPRGQHAGRKEPIAGAGEAANEERRTNERVHLSEPSGGGTACELHVPRSSLSGRQRRGQRNGELDNLFDSPERISTRARRPTSAGGWGAAPVFVPRRAGERASPPRHA